MSKLVSVKDVEKILEARQRNGSKPVLFKEQIEKLKKGEGFLITKEEWSMKTKPSSYFYQKLNKKGEIKVSCFNTEDGYLIVRQ